MSNTAPIEPSQEALVSDETQPEPIVVRVDNHTARYWEILQFNVEWLKFSETKSIAILTVYGVIFTITYTNATSVLNAMHTSLWITIAAYIYGVLSLISIAFSFLCLNPNLKNKNIDSMIYFGHISKGHKEFKEYKIYAQRILDNEDLFTDQITEQIFQNSRLALKKFRHVTWSLRFFIFSLGVIVLTVFGYITGSLTN